MDGKMVQDFSQLRVLPKNHTNRTHSSSNRRSLVVDFHQDEQHGEAEATTRMDALVHDLNSALEESTMTEGVKDKSKERNSNHEKHPHHHTSGKRRVWRRRCKSTSNLAIITQGAKTIERLPGLNSGIKKVNQKVDESNSMETVQNNSDDTGKEMDCSPLNLITLNGTIIFV